MNERSEHEIRESIEATRARMGETIEQIGDRVNPERVKADLKSKAREQIHEARDNVKRKARNTMRDVEHGVSDTGRGIWATIRENPVPAGMVGVGLAWLFANRRSGTDRVSDTHRVSDYGTYGTYSTGPSVPYRPEVSTTDATQWSGDGSGDRSEGIRDKASNVVHQASERLGDAQERVGDLAHEARYRARSAERRVEESMRENPMAAGAMALAFGVAAGLMIPESQREHRVMGRSRDRVLERAQEVASTTGHKLHDAAREAAGESARKAVDEMWPQDDTAQQSVTEPRRF